MNFRKLIVLICAFALLSTAANAQTSIGDLKTAHADILKKWLKTQKGWRLALEKDYDQSRLSDFKTAEKAVPFYSAKDFNRDKKEDFAVILINNGKYRAVVFNAPFISAKPVFDSGQIETGDILYYNKSTRLLLVGPYESDAGFQLKPSGKTYKVETFDF